MFDNYPPGTSAPLNTGTPNGSQSTGAAVDMYAGLAASAPLSTGANPAQSAQLVARPNASNAPLQYNNAMPGFNPEAAEVAGTGSLKFLVIGLVTLVLVLVGAFVVYQMVLKPKFENAVLTTDMPASDLMETPETVMDAIVATDQIASSSSETQIVYSPATSSEAVSSTETGVTSSTEMVVQIVEVDTDKDALTDDLETLKGTNKLIADTDADGLMDGEEVYTYSTDPLKSDSDKDGLADGEEVLKYKTKPLVADTDGDGYSDGDEVKNNYNPLGSGRLIVAK